MRSGAPGERPWEAKGSSGVPGRNERAAPIVTPGPASLCSPEPFVYLHVPQSFPSLQQGARRASMTSAVRSPRKTAIVHLALVAVVVWGSYIRLTQLWVGDLTLEELNHYYVGRALVEQQQPVLPSGVWYGRGVEYSRLTEWTSRFIGSPEVAVRLPSAVFGSLAVAALAAGTYSLAGPGAALAATLLFAVYPEA